MNVRQSLIILLLVSVAAAQQAHLQAAEHVEEEAPPQPYSFSYAAGRAPGHVDRVHAETRDAAGVVRGEFSYVDPRNRVRTVQYVADAHGFHPVLSHGAGPATDTPVVAAAKQRHLALKERIAADHARIGAEHARLQAEQAALHQVAPELTRAQETHEEPPRPYSFDYTAGRYPGHQDRSHSESRDTSGIVRGQYAYVDPWQRVRSVQYVADSEGFHPLLSAPPTDTPAVEAARRRHLAIKQRILEEHTRLAAERATANHITL